MTGALALRLGVAALILVLAGLVLRQHDQLITARLAAKDQAAVVYNLRRDIADRDRKILDRAAGEAADRGQADRSCAVEISSAFQKGVAVGRAINHAKTAPSPAPGRQPAAGGVLDYRQAWEADAFKPGAARSAAGGDLRAPGS